MSISESCCTTVIMRWCRDAEALHDSSSRLLFFFFFFQASRALFVFIGAEAERSCGECRTPYLTLGNCNLSWEEGVSLGDLPLNNYSHDKAINQAPLSPSLSPCPPPLLLWGESLIYLPWCSLTYDAHLWRGNPTVALPCQQEAQQRLKVPHRVRRATSRNQAKMPERRAAPKHNTQVLA